ncbi:uncharacterized protein SCHCODRAFT_02701238 [Schizophyllum commune H4-8]|uniref:uncharacterized protein n=1 Tax=Schizophyllum commune (strain H4-8 / FGSC 9210) TaxID=578458 RepID=UPI00216095CA|nr:uncharacterized protein SCHCODRAFT_02701238 [Schizophyllum commune H4-8]KAI5892267.1 hypothetical protein SCHCODRAFT_02701238 [Schizophyllum commune H4-8]
MADNATCNTVDEAPLLLMIDRTLLLGPLIGGGAWGVLIAVSFLTVRALFTCMSSGSRASRNYNGSLLAFVGLVFACGTINYATNAELSVRMFVENRLYAGGPSAFIVANYGDPFVVLGNASYIAASALADVLLVWLVILLFSTMRAKAQQLYRCYIVWTKRWGIIIVPACVYLASISMSILLLYQVSQPAQSLWRQVNFGLAYFSLSLAVNVLLTLLIAGRLLAMSKRVKATLGPQHAHMYTSIAALVVESASPYALTNLVFIITYGMGSPVSYTLLPILSQVMCTSAVLIILRVASGRAWSAQTTDLAFNEPARVGDDIPGKGGSRTMIVSSIHFKGSGSRCGGDATSEIQLAEV